MKPYSKKRADRNRTLTVTDDESVKLSQNLIRIDERERLMVNEIINKTLFGDLYNALDYLPKCFADLIIIDPPYNLDKNFHGFKFKSSDNDSYLEYLRSWFSKVVGLLKIGRAHV